VRLDIRRVQTLKKGSEGEYGIRAKVKVAKNKIAPPFRSAEFDIIFGKGISRMGCMLDLAEQSNALNRKGAWYSYKGDNIAQGRDNAVKYLEENPELALKIEQEVREKLDMGAVVFASSESEEESEEALIEEE
jgi:recombination protein RecA